jgi:8-oxo-dGTP pyrophosphatase MutT (NUDIX family)
VDDRLDPEAFWRRLRTALERVPADAKSPPPEARVGAVLVLLEETDAGPRVVLTRRRRDLRSHPGQVSFPGGRLDPGETIEGAALREAREEIGLDPGSVEVVGVGPTFYIPPSRFWVAPVLGRWVRPHPLTENPWEVDAVLEVPLTHLLDRDRWRHAPLSLRGSTWAWQLDDDLLWGATAMVMALLLDVAVEGWSDGLEPHDLGEDLVVRPWEEVPSWERRARLVGELPARAQARVEHVTTAQIRAVRRWLDERGVDALARAEQAGRALAHAVRRLRGGDLEDLTVTVLAGPSSNGAGRCAGRGPDRRGATPPGPDPRPA